MPVINSDSVRKTIAGKSGRGGGLVNEGIYSLTMTEKTYAMMAKEAEKQILSGTGAILDATFLNKAHREKIARLADKHKIPFFVIHCVASEGTIRKRLAQRAEMGKDVSDGRCEIYVEQRSAQQPFSEIPSVNCLELSTEAPLYQITGACERFLRSRIEQVRG